MSFKLVALGRRAFCEPGATYKYECNTCTCSPTGDDVSCTTDPCPPRSINGKF